MLDLLRLAGRRVEGVLFPSIVGGDPAGCMVSLTFDDGPTPGLTDGIGDLLSARGLRATFFVLLRQVDRHPDVVRQLVAAGHEIAIHGLDHDRLTQMSPAQVTASLLSARQRLRDLGITSARLMRPPCGSQDRRSYRATIRAGLTPVGWSADPADYAGGAVADVEPALRAGLVAGAIVLLPDGDGARADGHVSPTDVATRLAIAERSLDLAEQRGLAQATVSELTKKGARTARFLLP